MPPPQFDTVPQDVGAQLAKSQALRRLSTKSNTTPSSSKRSSARISKLGSTGNSPHNVQRRRTTATYTGRDHLRTPPDALFPYRKLDPWNPYMPRNGVVDARPYSWHPGTSRSSTIPEPTPVQDKALGNTITGLQKLAVAANPPSSVQHSIQEAFAVGYGYPILPFSASTSREIAASQALHTPSLPVYQTLTDSYPSYGYPEPYFPSYDPPYELQESSLPSWPPRHCADNNATYVPYQADSTYRVPRAADATQCLHSKELSEIPRDDGEALVGIGLYDKADDSPPSTTRSTAGNVVVSSSPSKHLKLVETWKPPNEDADDGESSEEPDEAEEVPIDTPITTRAPPTFYPPYDDLSNQSFFFDEDSDPYMTNDQYSDYMISDNNLAAMDPVKSQPAGSGNFLWF